MSPHRWQPLAMRNLPITRLFIETLLQLDGFLVIDKPEGMTSHDVVQIVRRHLHTRKVGHLGTLDPMATGVLPLALGKATRLVEFLKGGRKVYEGTIRLGFSTNTYDREGEPTLGCDSASSHSGATFTTSGRNGG